MAYANDVKLFGKWTYDEIEVSALLQVFHTHTHTHTLFSFCWSEGSEDGRSEGKRGLAWPLPLLGVVGVRVRALPVTRRLPN
mmetsp:Transcript_1482/g.4274  ORF Transcript_1482/g.4274 Transcript_1482/m.4274 type:complete len:82 (+) Transcript_1482:95-340(+)